MSPVTDDDLVLLYYGEHDDPDLAARVARDPTLSARLEELARTLALLDREAVPEAPADLGARTWQAIVPRLAAAEAVSPTLRRAPSIAARLFPFGGALAGALGLFLVAGLAFWLGRESGTTAPRVDPDRLLEARVGDHLADADILLTHLANGRGAGPREAELAGVLLVSNRIYRRAAEAAGRPALATLLARVERPLTDIANAPSLGTVVDASLLFRVRSQARRSPARTADLTNIPDASEQEVPHDRRI